MHRSAALTLAALVAPLLALPAVAERPLNQVNRELLRIQTAICAKADADGDSYRPFVCEPRCDCLATLLAVEGLQATCEESSPGTYDIVFSGAPTCSGGYCAVSLPFPLFCDELSPCPSGWECVSSCTLFSCTRACLLPCASAATCPTQFVGTAQLAGVSDADSPNAVQCTKAGLIGGSSTGPISSNDALECLEQVELLAGPCQ